MGGFKTIFNGLNSFVNLFTVGLKVNSAIAKENAATLAVRNNIIKGMSMTEAAMAAKTELATAAMEKEAAAAATANAALGVIVATIGLVVAAIAL